MGDPEPAYGAARYLEVLLSERYPNARFEVVHTGITAIIRTSSCPCPRTARRAEGDL